MTKPRRLRTDPTCRAKRRYPDEPSARAVGAALLAEHQDHDKRTERRWVYRCKHCDGWHVTKRGGGSSKGAPLTATETVA